MKKFYEKALIVIIALTSQLGMAQNMDREGASHEFVHQSQKNELNSSSAKNQKSTGSNKSSKSPRSIFYSLEEIQKLSPQEKLRYAQFIYDLTAIIEVVYYNQKETDPSFYVTSLINGRDHRMNLFMNGILPRANAEGGKNLDSNKPAGPIEKQLKPCNNIGCDAVLRVADFFNFKPITESYSPMVGDIDGEATDSKPSAPNSSSDDLGNFPQSSRNVGEPCLFGARLSKYVFSKNGKKLVCAPPPGSINTSTCRDSKNPKRNPKYQCPSFGLGDKVPNFDKSLCIDLYRNFTVNNKSKTVLSDLSVRCSTEFKKLIDIELKQTGVRKIKDLNSIALEASKGSLQEAIRDIYSYSIKDSESNQKIIKFCEGSKVQEWECKAILSILVKYKDTQVEEPSFKTVSPESKSQNKSAKQVAK